LVHSDSTEGIESDEEYGSDHTGRAFPIEDGMRRKEAFMRRLLSRLTPCLIALAAIPVGFLVMPDGLPFAIAACGSAYGNAISITGQGFTCLNPNGGANVQVDQFTLDWSGNNCILSATVDFRVNKGNCTTLFARNCDVGGRTACQTPEFQTLTTQTGIFHITKSVQCNGTNNDDHLIQFNIDANTSCDCDTDPGGAFSPVFFKATASADNCGPI